MQAQNSEDKYIKKKSKIKNYLSLPSSSKKSVTLPKKKKKVELIEMLTLSYCILFFRGLTRALSTSASPGYLHGN